MEAMPSMPEDQWKLYTQWVADFGASYAKRPVRHRNKVTRSLEFTRKCARIHRRDEAKRATLTQGFGYRGGNGQIGVMTGRASGKSHMMEAWQQLQRYTNDRNKVTFLTLQENARESYDHWIDASIYGMSTWLSSPVVRRGEHEGARLQSIWRSSEWRALYPEPAVASPLPMAKGMDR